MQVDEVRRHRRGAGARAARQEAAALKRGAGAGRALRAGPLAAGALARTGRGRIAAVQRQAVHLRLGSGELVTLLPAGTPLHPWAVTFGVESAEVVPPPAAFVQGDEVRVSPGALAAGLLTFDLEGMESADLGLHERPRTLPAGAVQALALLAARPEHGGPFDGAVSEALARFRAGGEGRDLVLLLGLGEGFTPAGDDVLIGVLAGLDCAGAASSAAPFLRRALVVALASGIEGRTTAFSAQMLAAAARGLYAEPVLGLVEVLAAAGGAPDSLAGAAAALLGMGHTSGADTLCGIAAALERALSI